MRQLRIFGTVIVALGLAGILVFALSLRQAPRATGAIAGAANPESPAPVPTPLATPLPELGCGTSFTLGDAPAPTLANRAAVASAIVIATVLEIGPAQWNTSDGSAPKSVRPPSRAHIYTPVRLVVDQSVKGSVVRRVTVRIPGGTVGCYSFWFHPTPDVKPGRQYAFFLGQGVDATGNPEARELTAFEAWPILAGVVATPLDGDLTLPAFGSQVAGVAP
jgi:hypothetical protein